MIVTSSAAMHQQSIRCEVKEWSAAVERVQAKFRLGYRPNAWLLSAHLFRHGVVIALAVLISEWFKSWPVYLVAVMLIGAHQVGIGIIGFHEGAHSLLHRKNGWNLQIGKILITLVGGQVLQGYEHFKARHLTHHRYLNSALDPDAWAPLAIKQKPVWKHVLFFVRVASGVQYIKFSIGYIRKLIRFRHFFAVSSLIAGSLLIISGAVIGVDLCFLFIKYWFIPMATWGFVVFYVRSYAEHPCVDVASDRPLICYTREISPTWFDALFLSTSGFSYHLSHHLTPWIPFYYLPKVHKTLFADPVLRKQALINRGYHHLLIKIFRNR